MGARHKHFTQSYRPGTVIVGGSFGLNGTDEPASVRGLGFEVARSGVGTFTVTFPEAFSAAESIVATASPAVVGDFGAEVGDYDAATRSFTIRATSGATAVDSATGRINFVAVMRNSMVGGN